MKRLLLFAMLTLTVSCSHFSTVPDKRVACSEEIPGLDALPDRGMILLGDLHGTREIPRFVGSLACALAHKGPVVLALEIPPGETASIDAYLDSAGTPAGRAKVLANPWWQERFQDGRRSEAMMGLIDSVRVLRHAGMPIDLLRFDVAPNAASPELRDKAMADAILAARGKRLDATFIVYAGNLHTARRGFPWKKNYEWMAMRLASAGVSFVSLDVRYTEGTTWMCGDDKSEHCGVSFVGSPLEQAAGVHLGPSFDGNYDGWFGVGAIHASPPAAFPELAKDLDARIAAAKDSPDAVRSAARRAIAAGDYRACADTYTKLLQPTGSDAYNHACCLARSGQRDAAFERLAFALAHGFTDMAQLDKDEDLASLRDDPRWPVRH